MNNRGWNPQVSKTKGIATPQWVEQIHEPLMTESHVYNYVVICPQAGRAFTLCLQLQRVNRALGSAAWRSQKIAFIWRSQESRRCACSPKNYHSATLEAMNSVRKLTFMFSCSLLPNLKQHCFLTAALHDISKARSRGGAATNNQCTNNDV